MWANRSLRMAVPALTADFHVDHLSHHQGNEELESGLQHFKKRGQYGDDRMGFQIAK